MSEREEVLLEPAFVLHHRPYRNTSQLLECLTHGYGRLGLIAQGSYRRERRQRAFLQAFVPLRLSWVRRGELGRLTQVEAAGPAFALGGERLLAAFYVNELGLRLLARGDANADAFACYRRCLAALASQESLPRTLRLFELSFLESLGYGLQLDHDAGTGEPLQPDRRYFYALESGPMAAEATADAAYWGHELISLRGGALEDPASLRAAKRLLGTVLHNYLGERPLKSRAVLKDIAARELSG
jgi:DNA repair protein RecO (recombination protein O)